MTGVTRLFGLPRAGVRSDWRGKTETVVSIAALKHPKGAKKSDRAIAEHCGVSSNTVLKYREQLQSAAQIAQVTEREGLDGKTYDTTNIGSTATEPRVLTKWREAMKHQGSRDDLGNNVTEVEPDRVTGNSKAYTLSRLEKDHPELFERVNSETADLPKSKLHDTTLIPATPPKPVTSRYQLMLTRRQHFRPVDASPGRWEPVSSPRRCLRIRLEQGI